MTKRTLIMLAVAALLSGCVTNTNLYDWGDYEETLFVFYHEPAYKEGALQNYLTFLEQHQGPKLLAPGLYAEAGTFMLEEGNIEQAIQYYRLESEQWPESRPLMSVLIDNLEAW